MTGSHSLALFISVAVTAVLSSGIARSADFSEINKSALLVEKGLVNKPLFVPGRKPPEDPPPPPEPVAVAPPPPPTEPVEAPAPPPPITPPSWELVGVILSSEGDMAVFRDLSSGGDDVLRLRVGDKQSGWELVEVKKRSVTIANGSVTEKIRFLEEEAG